MQKQTHINLGALAARPCFTAVVSGGGVLFAAFVAEGALDCCLRGRFYFGKFDFPRRGSSWPFCFSPLCAFMEESNGCGVVS